MPDRPTTDPKGTRPNIVLILADDMGFSDIGPFGSEIDTPNLDRLAAGGMRFTQMYNCARCCPTRASLLTGLYPHQTGVGHMVNDLGFPAYQGYLNDRCLTIAEALKLGGYRTMMSGKWHVGGYYSSRPDEWNPGPPTKPRPTDRGFDRFFGTLAGAGSYFNPHTLMEGEDFIEPEGNDWYYTDAISDRAVSMIEEASEESTPFFLYVAYTAPHWPLHAYPEDIEKYDGRYRDGWDLLRRQRNDRLVREGIVDEKWTLSPRDPKAPPWDRAADRDWEALRMAVYAAQIDRMDQGIGRILRTLRERNLEENTLVMFLSDNGGCAEFLKEDGRMESAAYPTRDGRPVRVGNIHGLRPGPETTFMSYDLPWANASNTPFRLYKHWVHEGGIGTPFIAYWPKVIAPRGLTHRPSHIIDIMPTCLEAAGVAYPSNNGQRVTPLEGESLLPLFQGQERTRRNPIFWEHEGNRAVRDGKWKLVSKHPGDWELYDMDADRTELDNLADTHRDKLEEMVEAYEEWAGRCGVVPWSEIQERRRKSRKRQK